MSVEHLDVGHGQVFDPHVGDGPLAVAFVDEAEEVLDVVLSVHIHRASDRAPSPWGSLLADGGLHGAEHARRHFKQRPRSRGDAAASWSPSDRRGLGRGVLAGQVPGKPLGVGHLRLGFGFDVEAVLLGDAGLGVAVVDVPPDAPGGPVAELGNPPLQIDRAAPLCHILRCLAKANRAGRGSEATTRFLTP